VETNQRTACPIGIFWDIENCQVPKHSDIIHITSQIREKFNIGTTYSEKVFKCYCDSKKMPDKHRLDLANSNVEIRDIPNRSKNSADILIFQDLQRFLNDYKAPGAVILISGDINFMPTLADIKNRSHYNVFIIHSANASRALLACGSETYLWDSFTKRQQSVEHREIEKNTATATSNQGQFILKNYNTQLGKEEVQKLLTSQFAHFAIQKIIIPGKKGKNRIAYIKISKPQLVTEDVVKLLGSQITTIFGTTAKLTFSTEIKRKGNKSKKPDSESEEDDFEIIDED